MCQYGETLETKERQRRREAYAVAAWVDCCCVYAEETHWPGEVDGAVAVVYFLIIVVAVHVASLEVGEITWCSCGSG